MISHFMSKNKKKTRLELVVGLLQKEFGAKELIQPVLDEGVDYLTTLEARSEMERTGHNWTRRRQVRGLAYLSESELHALSTDSSCMRAYLKSCDLRTGGERLTIRNPSSPTFGPRGNNY